MAIRNEMTNIEIIKFTSTRSIPLLPTSQHCEKSQPLKLHVMQKFQQPGLYPTITGQSKAPAKPAVRAPNHQTNVPNKNIQHLQPLRITSDNFQETVQ